MESSPVAPYPIVTVPVADLLRVTPFKGTDDIRYYLNGVLVMPYEDHALLMATNGHWMAIYESKESRVDKERILELPAWFLAQMIQAERGARVDDTDEEDESGYAPSYSPAPKTLLVNDEKSRLVVKANYEEVLVKPGLPFIDGKFPDYLKVLPDPATLEQGIFYPVAVHYLAALGEASDGNDSNGITCYHQRNAPDKPVVFRFEKLPELIVALMPLRKDESGEWPKWTQKPAKEDAA
jgi:hypothetical protein